MTWRVDHVPTGSLRHKIKACDGSVTKRDKGDA